MGLDKGLNGHSNDMNRIKWAGDGFRKGWNGQSNVMKRLGRP